ncbi:hypothetical protein PV729_04235 [Streptomyces europaeiscabiei]|uniref:Minor tail T domain-containing protein n=1 Tax=Streptomyces europaeiscabiei TaxID=146819 RepID=A0ABU4N665_9ACTN|nr:hypothetical protein [Streptomyces europaeiscabiei]MDX3550986.1 hypothetical protein [Streptomyces europaeiscabiei]MDX3698454.1 hypothetical protein [Streptomyces europaeiscabiei]
MFYFRLAGYLKAPSVAAMLARMSSRELSEWMAYEKVTGPLDSRLRGDISAGIVAATVANYGGAKKRAKPADFIPEWFKRKRTVREIWDQVMKANTALGGTYERS